MKHFFVLLATFAVWSCLTGCQTGGARKVTAARLEIRAPFESVAYLVQDRTCWVREVGHDGRILAESQRMLTPEEAANFWTELDHLQVREWRRDYGVGEDEEGLPVTNWRLITRRGKTTTSSQGAGAFPADDRPKSVVKPDTSARFQSLYALFQKTAKPEGTMGQLAGAR